MIKCTCCGTNNPSNRCGCQICGTELPVHERGLLSEWLGDFDSDSLYGLAFLIGCPIVFFIWLMGKWTELGLFTQIYLVGMFSYWVRWLLRVVANCVRLLSIFDRNMAQIGMRRNVFLGIMQERQSFSHIENVTWAMFGILLTSLLSWLAYLVDAYEFIKRLIYRWRTPREIKEIEWRVKTYLLMRLDVVRFDVKIAETLLGRRLTQEECDSRQQQLDRNGVDVKMTEVMALNSGERISERTHVNSDVGQQAESIQLASEEITAKLKQLDPSLPIVEPGTMVLAKGIDPHEFYRLFIKALIDDKARKALPPIYEASGRNVTSREMAIMKYLVGEYDFDSLTRVFEKRQENSGPDSIGSDYRNAIEEVQTQTRQLNILTSMCESAEK